MNKINYIDGTCDSYEDLDKIENRYDNMLIKVDDPTLFLPTKEPPYIYRWDCSKQIWKFVTDKMVEDNIAFTQEDIVIRYNILTLRFTPFNAKVWDIQVHLSNSNISNIPFNTLELKRRNIYGISVPDGTVVTVKYLFTFNSKALINNKINDGVDFIYDPYVNVGKDDKGSNIICGSDPIPDNTDKDKLLDIANINKSIKGMLQNIQDIKEDLYGNKIITTSKLLIVDDCAELPTFARGDIIYNTARIYNDIDSVVHLEYSCHTDGNYVYFSPKDNLSYKYVIVSYMSDT